LLISDKKLGLYKALADGGPMDERTGWQETTGTNVRYIREWLIQPGSSGYVEYDKETKLYSMTPNQAIALTDDDSPYYVGGGFYVVKAMAQAGPKIIEAFKNGGGMLWGDHDPDLLRWYREVLQAVTMPNLLGHGFQPFPACARNWKQVQ